MFDRFLSFSNVILFRTERLLYSLQLAENDVVLSKKRAMLTEYLTSGREHRTSDAVIFAL